MAKLITWTSWPSSSNKGLIWQPCHSLVTLPYRSPHQRNSKKTRRNLSCPTPLRSRGLSSLTSLSSHMFYRGENGGDKGYGIPIPVDWCRSDRYMFRGLLPGCQRPQLALLMPNGKSLLLSQWKPIWTTLGKLCSGNRELPERGAELYQFEGTQNP